MVLVENHSGFGVIEVPVFPGRMAGNASGLGCMENLGGAMAFRARRLPRCTRVMHDRVRHGVVAIRADILPPLWR